MRGVQTSKAVFCDAHRRENRRTGPRGRKITRPADTQQRWNCRFESCRAHPFNDQWDHRWRETASRTYGMPKHTWSGLHNRPELRLGHARTDRLTGHRKSKTTTLYKLLLPAQSCGFSFLLPSGLSIHYGAIRAGPPFS